ncbi:hypothetical protein L1S32_03140 [Methanogenium sp. S4BF]|uniref:hypothetical protein n=1 Tax=Methanogenium sp. S4BF TaxID=1789226 RepID=UPI002417EBB5|nr:hypothetical protein [Methanogenium sp. S4BF]WFN35127.1 hypothetical protein L1S32_03140 [Methanogenium sp. S4BF]
MRIMMGILWVGMALILFTPAMAYTIDGDLSDWGLSGLNTGDWSENKTWIPADGVSFIIEDNTNPWFLSDYRGVHISGTAESWKFYNEQQRIHSITKRRLNEPYGGEEYDMEAYYFDQDPDFIYLAIVTSLKPDGEGDTRPMDLALNFGNNPVLDDLGYEYGVKIREDSLQGSIIRSPVWEKSDYFSPAKPDFIQSGTGSYVGKAEISYTNSWLTRTDNGFDNYVIEIAIRKTDVGMNGYPQINSIYYGDSSMNEVTFAPEFPGIALSQAIITGMVFCAYLFRGRVSYRSCQDRNPEVQIMNTQNIKPE